MQIERLRVKNFRSFREIELALPPLSVVVGANASGKSNFVQVFRFLRDIAHEGFDNAVALQGGVEYLRNFHIRSEEPLEIDLAVAFGDYPPASNLSARRTLRLSTVYRLRRIDYSLKMTFTKRGSHFNVSHERFSARFVSFSKGSEDGTQQESTSEVIIERTSGKTDRLIITGLPSEWRPPQRRGKRAAKKSESESYEYSERLAVKDLSVLQILISPAVAVASEWFRDIAVYDFDVKLLKRPATLETRPFLTGDGSNLATVLQQLLRHKDTRHRLRLHLRRLLPFITDVRTQSTVEKTVAYQVLEQYSPSRAIPSLLLSDGTAEALALIVALYFTPSSLTIVEEPDKNLHPALVGRLLESCKEFALRKPLILTTHNPEVVRFTSVDNLLLVERDADGFSVIKRPADSLMVQEFLRSELMLSDLFVDNLLGV